VANRASFDERLSGELDRAQRDHRPLVLCLLDIDHFKKFNDTYGHQVGDQVLKAVAEALDGTARKIDVVARYGGEEFAVIAPGCTLAMAPSLGERLRLAVEEVRLDANGEQLQVTISVGLAFAQWPGNSKTAEELVRTADERLYAAKGAGRNCCRLEEGMQQAA
jgi:diguanylate cyclase (GGDEF)-like protein